MIINTKKKHYKHKIVIVLLNENAKYNQYVFCLFQCVAMKDLAASAEFCRDGVKDLRLLITPPSKQRRPAMTRAHQQDHTR